jgi:serine/threonine protein kinase/peroxiredoxin
MLAPDTVLQNRYRIVRKLGQGGMGAVYEAVDERVSCVVALKQTLITAAVDSREAFYREAALLANLRHPSLPKVMDYFTENNDEFLVMEFIGGDDLLQLVIQRDGRLPQVQVIGWAIELLKLLEYLHNQQPPIIHRDIKPANLKLTGEGEIFLLDFGLAKGTSGQMITMETDRSVPGYTPVYSPLEQILGQGTDPRSDLYAVGATLYHLLTGQPPVSAPARFNAIENNQPDPLKSPNQLNHKITPEVAACVQDSMALSRKDRTATARELRLRLEQALKLISDRELVHQVEQTLLDNSPIHDPAQPLIKDEDVQFTVYAPQKIKPKKNYTVLAFAHLSKRRDDADPDESDPLEEVKKQAERLLGEQRADYVDVKDSSKQAVPRGGELTFVPFVRGLSFSPPSRSFSWRKSVHREEFDVFAPADVDQKTLNGSITVFLGSIVIADVPLTISVDSNASSAADKIALDHPRSARRVRQVFASYSHKDEQVVAELAQVAPVFGSRFLLDRTHLEPGEDRVEGLQRLIRNADVFQLFWSNNSMRSPEIADEIRYAVGLGRQGFILPTYWEEPVPRSPEEGLPPPEIDRLQFYRIYPGAISQNCVESKLVITGPPGAEIYLDDERYASIGSSGRVILRSIATGQHILRITHSGERDDERIIEVGPQLGEQLIQANLRTTAIPGAAVPKIMSSVAESAVANRPVASVRQDTITAAFASPSETQQTSPVATTLCGTCGARLPPDTQFCGRCGSVLDTVSPLRSNPPSPSIQSAAPKNYGSPLLAKGNRRWMGPLFAGAAMVLLLVVVAPVWFMMSRSPGSVATTNRNTRPINLPTTAGSDPLQGFSFNNLEGTRVGLQSFRGRVVLLNFWTTRSAPSRNEIPVLNEIERNYASRGLTVIGVAADDSADQVRQIQKQIRMDYQVGVSAGDFKVPASDFPTTYVIDRRGQVRKKLVGVQSESALAAAIEPLLNEQP